MFFFSLFSVEDGIQKVKGGSLWVLSTKLNMGSRKGERGKDPRIKSLILAAPTYTLPQNVPQWQISEIWAKMFFVFGATQTMDHISSFHHCVSPSLLLYMYMSTNLEKNINDQRKSHCLLFRLARNVRAEICHLWVFWDTFSCKRLNPILSDNIVDTLEYIFWPTFTDFCQTRKISKSPSPAGEIEIGEFGTHKIQAKQQKWRFLSLQCKMTRTCVRRNCIIQRNQQKQIRINAYSHQRRINYFVKLSKQFGVNSSTKPIFWFMNQLGDKLKFRCGHSHRE